MTAWLAPLEFARGVFRRTAGEERQGAAPQFQVFRIALQFGRGLPQPSRTIPVGIGPPACQFRDQVQQKAVQFKPGVRPLSQSGGAGFQKIQKPFRERHRQRLTIAGGEETPDLRIAPPQFANHGGIEGEIVKFERLPSPPLESVAVEGTDPDQVAA